MPTYALKNTSGSIIRYQQFDLTAPILSPAKGLVWVQEEQPQPIVNPVVNPVPQIVSMAQARLALLASGLLETTNNTIAGMLGVEGEAARIKWEYSTNIRRDDSLVISLSGALNLTDTQVDDLFKAAILL